MKHLLYCLLLTTLGLWILPSQAATTDVDRARATFLDAERALKAGQTARFYELTRGLEDYPLYSYLRYLELSPRVKTASAREMRDFFDAYGDSPFGERLLRNWLYTLAGAQRWETFLEFYRDPQPTDLECHVLRARLAAQQPEGVLDRTAELWMVGDSQPSACDPLFERLKQSGWMTPDNVWERIRLAMADGQLSLAGFLAPELPEADRKWVELWQQVHNQPAKTLSSAQLRKDGERAREIVAHGLRRWAHSDAAAAWSAWQTARTQYAFDEAEVARTAGAIALSAASKREPRAYQWLSDAVALGADGKVAEWRARVALTDGDWSAILDSINTLPADEQKKDEWRYWKARALERTDKRIEAMTLFGEVAKERSFHGFLAADYLDWPYAMNNQSVMASPEQLSEMENRASLQRAREFYLLGRMVDARREWQYAIRDLHATELRRAAVVASQWGWHDRAIFTVARAEHYSDLKLRFPLAYQEQAEVIARENRLDPSLVMGVIRQESAFMPEVRSPAGAVGLMQLMPATGKEMARMLKMPYQGAGSLTDVDYNIRLGSGYLRRMLDKFGGNQAMAAAAYNAGPHRVGRWMPDDRPQSAELWTDLIPFTETRNYVRSVLAYTAIYEWRMDKPVTPISKRMPPVPPRER